MNKEMIALAQRLIDCPRFRWMPGMRSVAYRQAPLEPVVHRIGDLKLTPYPGSLPDLSDPATAGVLLGMLGRPTTLPAPWVSDWHAGVPLGEAVARALLVVWEAAP